MDLTSATRSGPLRSEWTSDEEIGGEPVPIEEIENKLLQGIFACRSEEAVEAALTYARFLNMVGITPENYPVFLQMLEIENHWVIDELIGDRDPFLLLSSVQPNRYIVSRVLAMLMGWQRGGIYHKNLSMILGVLQSVYSSARDGYRIYPLRIADLNAIGKHLNKEKGQDDPLNRAILDLLEHISQLEDAGDQELEEIAIHAAAIRNAFFDETKRLENVIPPVLLVSGIKHNEVPPRNEQATNIPSGGATARLWPVQPGAPASGAPASGAPASGAPAGGTRTPGAAGDGKPTPGGSGGKTPGGSDRA
jgi:hypothetical protein